MKLIKFAEIIQKILVVSFCSLMVIYIAILTIRVSEGYQFIEIEFENILSLLFGLSYIVAPIFVVVFTIYFAIFLRLFEIVQKQEQEETTDSTEATPGNIMTLEDEKNN